MRRILISMAMLCLAGCNDIGGETIPGVAVAPGGPTCGLTVQPSIVSFEDGEDTAEVVVDAPDCRGMMLLPALDDPDQAFAVDSLEQAPLEAPRTFVLSVQAEAPGTYEGQLTLALEGMGEGAVELYAEIPAAEE